jgi:hypothetical protein
MSKLTAALFSGLFITSCITTSVNSQPSSPSSAPTPQNPIGQGLPSKEAIANLIFQDAKKDWKFDAKGRVTKIESITLAQIAGFPWISATIPTWQITLESADQRLVYITNDTGAFKVLARRENLKLSPKVPSSVIQAVQQNFAYYNNPNYKNNPSALQPPQVLIKAATAQQWPDGCLGNPNPGPPCTLAPVFGWQILGEGKPEQYNTPNFTYRSDATGNFASMLPLRCAMGPSLRPETGDLSIPKLKETSSRS